MKKALVLYGVLLVVMTAGMIAITNRLLTLERQEQISALRAENERLALWRIESQLLPIVLRESSRDYADEWLFDESAADIPPDVLVLFRGDLNHGIDEPGSDPAGTRHSRRHIDVAGGDHRSNANDLAATRHLLMQDFKDERFVEAIQETWHVEPTLAQQIVEPMQSEDADLAMMQSPSAAVQQAMRSQNEFASRSRNALSNSILARDQRQLGTLSFGPRMIEPMRAVWVDDRLYLARVNNEGKLRFAEGCRFNWPYLKASLLNQVADLLPSADLVPLLQGDSDDFHAIANLPLRLIPGEPDLSQLATSSALLPTLAIAWGCFAASALALGGLLVGTIRLSERRGAFVSAVTHELRTPLTTFRLYSDLLVDRTRLSDEKYGRYISTLRNEAERLQHLIENVLSWSRLERSSEMELTDTIQWTDFLDRVEPSMRERVQQAGMTLHVEPSKERSICFQGNRTSVERVLFNLVDNACKYAKHAVDKRIELGIESGPKSVVIRIRDHGPGIAADVQPRLFCPFAKSASQAATSAPGIGLGLSLSRRLARDMGGDLRLAATSKAGTTFELRLPSTNVGPAAD